MKITIVTITLNSEKYLPDTIESVLNQDYLDFEYIIVDGGSSDRTVEIINEYAFIDERIKWVTGFDSGISDAMNKGIALATGEVITHLHSDDYYPVTDVLSSIAEKFDRNPQLIWVTGGVYLVDKDRKTIREIKVRNYSYRKLVRGNCIFHPATFVRNRGFAQVGMFEVSLKYAMDYDLWLRLGAISAPLTISKALACFRVHDGSLSVSQYEQTFTEELQIRKRLMPGEIFRYSLHYFYYVLKKMVNPFFVRNVFKNATRIKVKEN